MGVGVGTGNVLLLHLAASSMVCPVCDISACQHVHSPVIMLHLDKKFKVKKIKLPAAAAAADTIKPNL